MTSPTQLSLAYLRKNGYTPYITEHWNSFSHTRQDLYGFIDLVSLKEGTKGIIGIQTTSLSNLSARYKKIISIPQARLWLSCGNSIFIHGWSKKGARWTLKEKEVTLEDFTILDSDSCIG